MVTRRLLVPFAVLVSFAAAPAWADSIFNDYADYGHAANNGPYCAATSIANSLGFLETKTGLPLLTNGSAADTRDAIRGMETLSGNGLPPNPPASNAEIWNSKVQYVNEMAPGQIKVEGYIPGDLTGYANGAALNGGSITNGIPTRAWMEQQLQAGQDVEIAFGGIPLTEDATDALEPSAANADAHMVTLTGLDDVSGEFQYLDPNAPGGLITATMSDGSGATAGYEVFDWNNGVNSPVNGVFIYEAFAESPVPEPASLMLLAAGSASLVLTRRRRA